MPGYAGAGQAGFLDVNRQAFLWLNDTVAAGSVPASFSLAYQIRRLDNSFYPWGLSLELSFAANPGSFEVDILGANTDALPNYILLGSITQASASGISGTGGFVYRYDMASNLWPRYVVGYMKTLGNAVAVTLQATR